MLFLLCPLLFAASRVQRATHSPSPAVEHMRVDHRRPHVFMSQKFLHGADIVTIFEQVSRKRMPECMATSALYDSGGRNGSLNGDLNRIPRNMMSPFFSASGIN